MTMKQPTAIENSLIPEANILTQISAIDSNAAYATVQILAVNDGAVASKIKIAISSAETAGAVQRKDFIDVGDIVDPAGRASSFGILVPGNRRIYVMSETGEIIFRVAGLVQIN